MIVAVFPPPLSIYWEPGNVSRRPYLCISLLVSRSVTGWPPGVAPGVEEAAAVVMTCRRHDAQSCTGGVSRDGRLVLHFESVL